MLYNPKIQRPASVTPPALREMSGRKLSRLVKKGSPRDRASLALDLERGAVQLLRPTRAQASALTQASSGYIGTLARLSEDERRQLAKGELALSHVHHRQGATDVELDRVVRHYGAAALWRAFERVTSPRSDKEVWT